MTDAPAWHRKRRPVEGLTPWRDPYYTPNLRSAHRVELLEVTVSESEATRHNDATRIQREIVYYFTLDGELVATRDTAGDLVQRRLRELAALATDMRLHHASDPPPEHIEERPQ